MDDLIESELFRSASYVVTGLACGLVSFRWSRRKAFSYGWLYWAGAACLMFSFGLLKVTGAEQVVQQTGRDIADRGGIYDVRRGYQLAILIAISWSGLLWLLGFIIALRQQMLWRLLPGLASMTALTCYVLARGVSYHKVDTALYRRESVGVQNSALIEVLLLALVFGVTMLAFRAARYQPPSLDIPSQDPRGSSPRDDAAMRRNTFLSANQGENRRSPV
jgi:hypothetical protein